MTPEMEKIFEDGLLVLNAIHKSSFITTKNMDGDEFKYKLSNGTVKAVLVCFLDCLPNNLTVEELKEALK